MVLWVSGCQAGSCLPQQRLKPMGGSQRQNHCAMVDEAISGILAGFPAGVENHSFKQDCADLYLLEIQSEAIQWKPGLIHVSFVRVIIPLTQPAACF